MITRGATTLSGLLIDGLKSSRTTGNIIHPIIDRASADVTFGPATLRTGTISVLCDNLAGAQAMETMHLESGTFALDDTDASGMEMVYVPSGQINVTLDLETRVRYIVEVDFQEVLP